MKIWSKDLMLEKLSYDCLQGIKLIWLLSHWNLIQLHKIFNMYTYVICSFAIFNQKLKCAMKSSHMYRFNVHMYFFYFVQVNLSQKLLFLHQLSHNMTTYCSLNCKFNTGKFQAQNMGRTCCVQKLTFRTIFVHNMFSTCSAKRRASDEDLPVSTHSNHVKKIVISPEIWITHWAWNQKETSNSTFWPFDLLFTPKLKAELERSPWSNSVYRHSAGVLSLTQLIRQDY